MSCIKEKEVGGKMMVRIKNKEGKYLCLAWASKDASKAFEITEELAAKVMFSAGIGNCIVENVKEDLNEKK